METSTARAIHDPAAAFYVDALRKLRETGIPFLLGGAFALCYPRARRLRFLGPLAGGYLALALWMAQHPGALTARYAASSTW